MAPTPEKFQANSGAGETPRNRSLKFVSSDDHLATYLSSIRNTKKLSSEEERSLADRIQKGDKRAVNILVSANLKFVVSVCRNYQNRGLPLADLINEGNLGLIRGAQRFDAGKDCRFISYAVWWIRQGIVTALSEQTRFLKVAPSRIQTLARIAKAAQMLEQKFGRKPLLEEIADVVDIIPEKITEYLQTSAKSISLNAPGFDGGPGLEESLEDRNSQRADHDAMEYLTRKRMASLLDSLDERKAMVLKLHYGIGTEFAMPLADIAVKMNLTRERVRQIKAQAISILKHPTKASLTEPFLS